MANFITILLFVYTCAAAYAGYPWTHHGSHFPIVDVGYGRYQASLNETGNYYNFSNIRYAEPPVGSLRFSLPVSPRGRDTSVDTGSIARICPQAYPTGGRVNERYNTYYSLTGKTSIAGFENSTQGFDYPRNAPSDSRITEDCLFLDVMVPREIFHARQSRRNKTRTGAAVMVWLHGGGFCAGSKYDTPAAGLIARSQTGDNEGVIYVTLNYRLGAFGWMSGPTFAKDGTPNAGLYDQRLALQWVRDNIHRFGGDPTRVTVFGESAGGGSIILQTTAFGGRRVKTPFKRAILQSPGWTPMAGNLEQEQIFRKFLGLLNVSTLAEAKVLPSIVLQAASEQQIRTGTKGWTYGPVVDGDIIPALPSLLLAHGRYDDSIDVLVGHNGDEGFGYPLANDSAFDTSIKSLFPNAPPSSLDHITKVLYPPQAPSTGPIPSDYHPETSKSLIVTGYNDTQGRQALFQSDTVIKCNTHFVNAAFAGRTYAYVLSVPPALHGQDLYYVFYNGQATDVYFRPLNVTLAHIMQDYWINFANNGSPNGVGLPVFPRWGRNASVQGMAHDDVGPIRDPIDVETCRWWGLGVYV